MFKPLSVVLAVVLLGTYFLATSPAQDRGGDQRPASWRHLALTAEEDEDRAELARQINRLGAEGWELVDVENFVSGGETVKTVYFFKRPE